jgi:hypothetical protein
MSPPKAKRGPAKTALQVVKLQLEYHALHLLQTPFTYVFRHIEQHKARLQDRIENQWGRK